MGVVNVTPDSFSDGGEFLDAGAAIAHARRLVRKEPTSSTSAASPRGRGPSRCRRRRSCGACCRCSRGSRGRISGAQVSIDTSKAAVAAAAIEAGATLVNDVTALRGDAAMAGLVADGGVECCLMHMLGEPRTMQRDPRYGDVVDEVKAFLEERLDFAVAAGVREELIMLDPGIGFGKTVAHNLELLDRLEELTTLGRPLVVGTSRKGFLGRILADAAGGDGARRLGGGACRERSPPTCSRSSAARACFACTTSLP